MSVQFSNFGSIVDGIGVVNQIAETSLENLKAESVLGRLVYRDLESDFTPGVGATMNVRKPTKFAVKNLAKDGEVKNEALDEKLLPVVIDTHAYASTLTNTWNETLDIADVVVQITGPLSAAVAVDDTVDEDDPSARSIEARIADEFKKVIDSDGATAKDAEGKVIPKAIEHKSKSSFRDTLVKVDAQMNANKVPLEGRRLVVSPDFRAEILSDDLFVKADSYGSPQVIQRGGAIDAVTANHMGNFLGFDVYLSTMLDGAVAFTREAFALAVAVPVPMEGAVSTAVSDKESGYGMRLTKAAVPSRLSTQVSTDVLCGAAILDADRCVGIKIATA
ncbi:hypothetical protein [Streptomyces sp. NPDC059009]|uniref:hypothetical protein n=1 Tax=Streptomyces sp. NPDC059009 TaxID=3346694 RepID=UPI003694524A